MNVENKIEKSIFIKKNLYFLINNIKKKKFINNNFDSSLQNDSSLVEKAFTYNPNQTQLVITWTINAR